MIKEEVGYKVLLFGSTGSIGSGVFQVLQESELCKKIVAITRKKLEIENNKIVNIIWNNFDDFLLFDDEKEEIKEKTKKVFEDCDVVIDCLGISWRSSRTKENYIKINQTYHLNIGKICSKLNPKGYFYMLSNIEAKSSSKAISARIKGELEDEVKKLKFKGLAILKPALILDPKKKYKQAAMRLMMPIIALSNKEFLHSMSQKDFGKGIVFHFEHNFTNAKEFGIHNLWPSNANKYKVKDFT